MFYRYIIPFLFSTLVFQFSVKADNQFADHPTVSSAHVGYQFYNVNTGEEVASFQAKKSFIPASLLKLVSTVFALEVLKNDFSFSTEVFINGSLKKDTLIGNLVIYPAFDPSLSFNNFSEQILKALKLKNIKVVKGTILFDEENSTLSQLPQSWLFEDIANYYGSQAHAFNLDENRYALQFRQAKEGMPCSLESVNPAVNLVFDNQVMAGAAGSGDQAYILGSPFSIERKIVGTIPAGDGLFSIKGAVANPKELFAELIAASFSKNGIAILNETIELSPKQDLLLRHHSKLIAALLKTTNQKSNNLYAEALLLAAGKQQNAKSYEEVLENLELWLQKYDLPTQNIAIYDACGLSRLNSLSPQFLVDFLVKMIDNQTFINSLAISGESGTLKYFSAAQLRGNLRAKSGSSRGILNYAGYFKNAKGETIAFAIMINQHNVSSSSLKRHLISLIETVYQK